MLHYFMVTLDPAVAGMNEHEWATLEANVSCVAAEEFFAGKNPQKIKGAPPSGTKKYYDEIKVFAANNKLWTCLRRSNVGSISPQSRGVVRRRRMQLSLRDCSRI